MTTLPSKDELVEKIHSLEQTNRDLLDKETELKDEIAWLRLMVNESRDGIVIVDQDCKVNEANKRFAEMLGYTEEEVYQLFVWDWDTQFSKEQILDLSQTVDNIGHRFETRHRRKDGTIIDVELSNNGAFYSGRKLIFCVCRDISERKREAREKEMLVNQLQKALAEVKTLKGILSMCSYCNKIRDDKGNWVRVDVYIADHSQADLSHGICPECCQKHFPIYAKKNPSIKPRES